MRKFLTVLLVLAIILCTGAACAQKSATCVATDIDPENPAMQTVYVRFLGYNEDDNTATVELLTPEMRRWKPAIRSLPAGKKSPSRLWKAITDLWISTWKAKLSAFVKPMTGIISGWTIITITYGLPSQLWNWRYRKHCCFWMTRIHRPADFPLHMT